MSTRGLLMILLAGMLHSWDAEADQECNACHPEHAMRGIGSVMAIRELNGRRVSGCLDCHATRSAEPGGCTGVLVVPLDRCFACHFDPRNLPLNPAGTVATHYGGRRHERLGGLLCQDCHTSDDVHGGASSVALTCVDCHGTLATEPRRHDGRVLDARGVPLDNVVARDDELILLSATGRVYPVAVLRRLDQRGTWTTELGRRAMAEAAVAHADLDCLDCHADWAPTCHGCHAEEGDH